MTEKQARKVTRDLGREESRDVVQSGGSLRGEESLGAEHSDERAAQFHRSQLKRQGPEWPCSAQGLGWSSVAQPSLFTRDVGPLARRRAGRLCDQGAANGNCADSVWGPEAEPSTAGARRQRPQIREGQAGFLICPMRTSYWAGVVTPLATQGVC